MSAADLARVRATLVDAGYAEPGVSSLLGEPSPGLSPDERQGLLLHRARGRGPLPTLVRAFLLGQSVPSSAFRRAVGGLEPWRRLGFVRLVGGRALPRVHLSIHGAHVIASDLPADTHRARRLRDVVHPPTTASLLLASMLLHRARVRRALDLGTGTGLLALRLAEQADDVVATDVSARALAFARTNAALTGARNVSFVRSDGFAALGRRRFDLIVGNLPFVVSPERRFTFRDAGRPLDAFLAGIVGATGRHLVEGGWAQYLGQWVHCDGQDEDERLAPWFVAAGCDALVLRLDHEPVDVHAARWCAGPTPLAPRERARRLERWVSALGRAGVTAVSTGLFTLRRRRGPRHAFAVEDATGARPLPSSAQIAAWFDALSAGT